MAAIHPPREELIANFHAKMASPPRVDAAQGLRALGLYIPPSSPAETPYAPCTVPVDALKLMFISQLKSQRHHRGRKLIVRTCTPPVRRLHAIVAVVEDTNGDAILLYLHNMPTATTVPSPDTILPEGTVCIIKEPLMKPKTTQTKYCIRVDHVTDIVFLDGVDKRVPDSWRKSVLSGSSEEIRAQGNAHVKERNWSSALQLYSDAIDAAQTEEEEQLAHINRAIQTTKSLFRLAMAHYGLRDYESCRNALLRLLAASPEEPSAKSELVRVTARLREQSTGRYSFASMYAQERTKAGLVDCASYYGPVEVRESPGRGRGLFLTKPVSVGGLILCEKAVVFHRRAPTLQNVADFMVVNVQGCLLDSEAKRELSAQAHQELLHNFEACHPILDLYSGVQEPKSTITEPGAEVILDSFQINSIIEFNALCVEDDFPDHGGEASHVKFEAADGSLINNGRPPSDGVWLRASYINHACYPNCHRVFIGDMVIVRAARDLAAGTELLATYTEPTPFDSLSTAQDKLRRWEFVCCCDLCEARKRVAEHESARRPSILKKVAEAFTQATPGRSEEVLRACRDIDAMYPSYAGPDQTPCIEIWTLSFPRRSSLLILKKGTMAIIDAIATALQCVGFVVSHSHERFEIAKWGMLLHRLPAVFEQLHEAYREVNPRVCPAIRDYARTAFLVMVGEDETFGKAFPSLVGP
ncbi:hypothetical protein V2A60_006051 [Cordyceps javanica]